MKKIILIVPILFLLFSCNHKTTVPDDRKDAKSDLQQEGTADQLIPIDSSTASEPFLAFSRIMDTAMERASEAQTPEEVIAAADWYYDHYYGLAEDKGIEWANGFTPNERNTYNQRHKEFTALFRERYVELGGTPAQRKVEVERLIIKCMDYDAELKAQHENTATTAETPKE